MVEFSELTGMALHDVIKIDGISILRVPGGWIYRFRSFTEYDYKSPGVFVPFVVQY